MWIEDLYLEDFGCYRHERVEGLGEGLVVIGGPQRAGKTTLMSVLRYLGFGFPRNKSLPPAADEYSVQAQVQHSGCRYLIDVSGYASPKIVPQNGADSVGAEELYGGLSSFYYHQLFTISLDELKRVPPSAEDEEHKLQTVLLGAGWADIARIPKIKEKFEEEAKKIGGKHGRASYQLKAPLQQIKRGVKERDKALEQVEQFRALENQFDELKQKIEQMKGESEKKQHYSIVLSLLREYWSEISEYKKIKRLLEQQENQIIMETYPASGCPRGNALQERFMSNKSEISRVKDSLESLVGSEDFENRVKSLVDNQESLRIYENELSGWRERVRAYRKEHQHLEQARAELQQAAGTLWDGWRDDYLKVGQVKTDLVGRSQLKKMSREHSRLREKADDIRRERQRLNDRLSGLRSQLSDIPQSHWGRRWIQLLAGYAGSGLLGWFLSGYGGTWFGAGLGAAAAFAVSAFFVPAVARDFRNRQSRSELLSEITGLQQQLDELRKRNCQVNAEVKKRLSELSQLKKQMGFPQTLDCSDIVDFYDRVMRLKQRIQQHDTREQMHHKEAGEISEMLSGPVGTLKDIRDFRRNDMSFLHWAEDLFAQIEVSVEELEWAVKYERLRDKCSCLRSQIVELLKEEKPDKRYERLDDEELTSRLKQFCSRGRKYQDLHQQLDEKRRIEENITSVLESEAHRDALTAQDEAMLDGKQDDVPVFGAFLRQFADFISKQEVLDEHQKVLGEIDDIEATLKDLQRTQVEIEQKMHRFSTDENLKKAQDTIQEGRYQLKPMAREYGKTRIAAVLLERLHKRFIDKTHGALLEDAGRIFRQITGDTYQKIDTVEDISQLDFRAVDCSSSTEWSSSALSGATREQLFLAVRLARIKEVEPPLPVILDDSTANFDPAHRLRTAQIINELSQTHQVFLLTCHPEMVELIGDTAGKAQYWYLSDGSFSQPFTDHIELVRLLDL